MNQMKKQLKNLPQLYELIRNKDFNKVKLPKNKNHSTYFQAKLVKHPELVPNYVDYYIQNPFFQRNPANLIELMLKSGDLKRTASLVKFLSSTEAQLTAADFKRFFMTLVTYGLDYAFLDAIKELDQLFVGNHRDFFIRNAYLTTLDLMETIKQENYSYCGEFFVSAIRKLDSFVPECTLQMTLLSIKENIDLRANDMVLFRYSVNGTEKQEFAQYLEQTNEGYIFQLTSLTELPLEQWVRVEKITTLNTYFKEKEALVKLTRCDSPLVQQLVGNHTANGNNPFIFESDLYSRNLNPSLNPSQLYAIKSVLNSDISLIQGPPGTGKTFTLANLVKYVSENARDSVLVATPTNASADNVVEYCIKLGLKVVRTGDYTSVRPDLKDYSLESIVGDPLGNFDQSLRILRRCNVVVTTVASAGSVLLERMSFGTVIIDEASQVTETLALIPALKAKQRLILVGDHKQLPPSVGYLASNKGFSQSMFSRLARNVKPLLLDTQYRSHPLIMDFSSKMFYNGELKHGVKPSERVPPKGFPWKRNKKHGIVPVAFVPLKSQESQVGLSKVNAMEADIIIRILKKLIESGLRQDQVGVISPYAGQNRLLVKYLKECNLEGVEQNSVDGFQGREKEVILFCATRANSAGQVGFLKDERRLNVMHTRARRGLVVVGNPYTLDADKHWREWLRWVEENNLVVHPFEINK
jgi:KaiC/GvpD/RAD55 family RecA-like ATPase